MKPYQIWRSLTTTGRMTSQARDLLMHVNNLFASDRVRARIQSRSSLHDVG